MGENDIVYAISGIYEDAIENIKLELDSLQIAILEAKTLEELQTYFFRKWVFEPIYNDTTKARDFVPTEEFGPVTHIEGYGDHQPRWDIIDIEYPISHTASTEAGVGFLRAHHPDYIYFGEGRQTIHYSSSRRAFIIRVFPLNVEPALESLRNLLAPFNSAVADLNPEFHDRVYSLVADYRAQRLAAAEVIKRNMASYGLVLRERANAVKPMNLEVKEEIVSLRKFLSAPPTLDYPRLSVDDTNRVLRQLVMAGRNFEIASKVYLKLSEEDLRSILVSILNAVFEIHAVTAESFVGEGRTDILLNAQGGPVLIAECKKWGNEAYGKAITQLFKYLRWPSTQGVIITFTTKIALAKVLKSAKRSTTRVRSRRGPLREGALSDSSLRHFISTHISPRDAEQHIDVHHLFFDLTYEDVVIDGPAYNLQQLRAAITPVNLHSVVTTGRSVGNEAW